VYEIPAEGDYDVDAAERAELLAIHAGGSRPPLFLIRTWKGEIEQQRALARYLGPEQPLVSLGLPRGEKVEDFPRDAHTWADIAVAKFEQVPHAGPYLVGGWSMGGLIGYETAQRLSRAGHEVALVVLFDSAVPSERELPRKGIDRRGSFQKFVRELHRYLELRTQQEKRDYLRARLRRRREKLAKRVRRVSEWTPSEAFAKQNEPAADAAPDAVWLTSTGRRITLLERTIWVAYRKYRPTEMSLPVLLVRCEKTAAAVGRDAAFGWAPALRGELESVLVPGTHHSMWDEPNVGHLARRLDSALRRAVEKPGLVRS
jgi:thioesterase domain-containing protein